MRVATSACRLLVYADFVLINCSDKMSHQLDKKWRSEDVILREKAEFSSLLLSDRVLRGLNKAGFKIPSPIQLEAIPIGRFGKDLLVQAKSGTGKTLVFTIIALEILKQKQFRPQVLILAPAREIAAQICSVVQSVGSCFYKLTCCSFIGGLSLQEDKDRASACQIIVGTPGRIKQLIGLGSLPINSIRLLVLDEADQLFIDAFKSDIDDIFQCLPVNKQVIATSATFPAGLKKTIFHYLRDPFVACINSNDLALLGIVHYTTVVSYSLLPMLEYKNKLQALEKILTTLKFSQCLVFCNMIGRVETLYRDIKKWGFSTSYISSAKEQAERLKALDELKHFKCKVLVSSDVISRGIDAENVDLVINFDLAYSTETYLHRVGRAGRYGSIGLGITILTNKQLLDLKWIEEEGGFQSYKLPDPLRKDLIRNPSYDEYTFENEFETNLADDCWENESSIKETEPTSDENKLKVNSFDNSTLKQSFKNHSLNGCEGQPNVCCNSFQGTKFSDVTVSFSKLSAEVLKDGDTVDLSNDEKMNISSVLTGEPLGAPVALLSDLDKANDSSFEHTNQTGHSVAEGAENNVSNVSTDQLQDASDYDNLSTKFESDDKLEQQLLSESDAACLLIESLTINENVKVNEILENDNEAVGNVNLLKTDILDDTFKDKNTLDKGEILNVSAKSNNDVEVSRSETMETTSNKNKISQNPLNYIKDDIENYIRNYETSSMKVETNCSNLTNGKKNGSSENDVTTVKMKNSLDERDCFLYNVFKKFQESENSSKNIEKDEVDLSKDEIIANSEIKLFTEVGEENLESDKNKTSVGVMNVPVDAKNQFNVSESTESIKSKSVEEKLDSGENVCNSSVSKDCFREIIFVRKPEPGLDFESDLETVYSSDESSSVCESHNYISSPGRLGCNSEAHSVKHSLNVSSDSSTESSDSSSTSSCESSTSCKEVKLMNRAKNIKNTPDVRKSHNRFSLSSKNKSKIYQYNSAGSRCGDGLEGDSKHADCVQMNCSYFDNSVHLKNAVPYSHYHGMHNQQKFCSKNNHSQKSKQSIQNKRSLACNTGSKHRCQKCNCKPQKRVCSNQLGYCHNQQFLKVAPYGYNTYIQHCNVFWQQYQYIQNYVNRFCYSPFM